MEEVFYHYMFSIITCLFLLVYIFLVEGKNHSLALHSVSLSKYFSYFVLGISQENVKGVYIL